MVLYLFRHSSSQLGFQNKHYLGMSKSMCEEEANWVECDVPFSLAPAPPWPPVFTHTHPLLGCLPWESPSSHPLAPSWHHAYRDIHILHAVEKGLPMHTNRASIETPTPSKSHSNRGFSFGLFTRFMNQPYQCFSYISSCTHGILSVYNLSIQTDCIPAISRNRVYTLVKWYINKWLHTMKAANKHWVGNKPVIKDF